jgi:endonuclease/exonuclease/phosphatase family metal-dependent hydrolase
VTYHLFGTHLNAYNSKSQTGAEVRRKQAQQLKDAFTELDIPASEAVIIAGDLNVNLNGDFKLQRTDREPYRTMQLLEAEMPQVVFGTDGLRPMKGTHSGGDLSELNTATKAWLDYTLTSTAHLAPDTATMQAIPLTVVPFVGNCPFTNCAALEQEFTFSFPRMRLLSDHLPVLGKFVFPLPGA